MPHGVSQTTPCFPDAPSKQQTPLLLGRHLCLSSHQHKACNAHMLVFLVDVNMCLFVPGATINLSVQMSISSSMAVLKGHISLIQCILEKRFIFPSACSRQRWIYYRKGQRGENMLSRPSNTLQGIVRLDSLLCFFGSDNVYYHIYMI